MKERAPDFDMRSIYARCRAEAIVDRANDRWRAGKVADLQNRFGRRLLRTVEEYKEKVEHLHLNPVEAGLFGRAQDWRWPSVNE